MLPLGLAAGTAAATPASGPALLTPSAELDAAYRCDVPIAPGGPKPVLLVHGTWSTGPESWTQAFGPALASRGVPTCTIDVPKRATEDLQVSVEYVVDAVRRTAQAHDGKIDLVGHSQGGALIVAAAKFWPDVATSVDDVIGLASSLSPNGGGGALCVTVGCPKPFQQLRPDARWSNGFVSQPLPQGPSFTSVSTEYDEIVTPQPSASYLAGARNIVLQDICPGKPVEHLLMLTDATAFAITYDALTNPGAADPARIDRATCTQIVPDGVNIAAVPPAAAAAGIGFGIGIIGTEPALTEPPVRCYVVRSCRTDDLDAPA